MDDKWHEKFVTVLGVNAWAPEWYPHSITEFDADTIAAMVKKPVPRSAPPFRASARTISV